MNSITFDGRLGRDAELRYTQSGDPILTFAVGSDIGFGDKKTTNWFNCQVWGKRAEALQQYLVKGQSVTVYGQLTLREYEKDGIKRWSPDVRVNEIALQGGRQEGGQQQSQGGNGYARETGRNPAPPQRREAPQRQQRYEDDLDGDVPF